MQQRMNMKRACLLFTSKPGRRIKQPKIVDARSIVHTNVNNVPTNSDYEADYRASEVTLLADRARALIPKGSRRQ